MKILTTNIAVIAAMLFAASCEKSDVKPEASNDEGQFQSSTAARVAQGNSIPSTSAFYDDELFTINLMEFKDKTGENLIEHNKNLNEIYAYDDLDEEQEFFPIIDAIPGDGFNPLWLQLLIVFNDGYTPRQLESDVEVDEAVESGEIRLVNTGEIYRCAVTAQKPSR